MEGNDASESKHLRCSCRSCRRFFKQHHKRYHHSQRASAGAVLALIGSLWGKETLKVVLPQCIAAISIFATGVGLAIITSGIAYLAQLFYAYGDLAQFDEKKHFKILQRTGVVLHSIAVVFGLLAILSFCGGAWYGIEALRSLTVIPPDTATFFAAMVK